jgi:small subunit ribosomal protein S5
MNVVQATINGLNTMVDAETVAAKRGKTVEEILG